MDEMENILILRGMHQISAERTGMMRVKETEYFVSKARRGTERQTVKMEIMTI